MNLNRSEARSCAQKNSVWYDLNVCHEKWHDVTTKFIKYANNKKLKPVTRIKFCGLLKVVDLIDFNFIVPLREAWDVYSSSCKEDYNHLNLKSPKYIFVPSDARDFFLRNMPLIVVYKDSVNGPRTYLTKRLEGVHWEQLLSLAWPTTDQLRKEKKLKQLKDFVKPALSYATSTRDRNILKCLFTMVFGASAVSKKFGFRKRLLSKNKDRILYQIEIFDEVKTLSKASHEAKKRKREEVDIRQPGSGRPFIADKYPQLSSCMLMLFDSCGSGLQSHPRLICKILFMDNKHWLDMPRAVSIINQVYGIPFVLSTAYTYTQHFRRISNQANRHH